MSDLQCAATVIVIGADRVGELLVSLREHRVALVYAGGSGVSAAAERLADELDVALRPATVSDGMPGAAPDSRGVPAVPDSHGSPGAVPVPGAAVEPVPAAGARSVPALDAVLDGLADEHRGECVVLVVGDDALTALARRSSRDGATALVIDLDDDGRRVDELPLR